MQINQTVSTPLTDGLITRDNKLQSPVFGLWAISAKLNMASLLVLEVDTTTDISITRKAVVKCV
jgi:hypothetical protein